MAADGEVAIFNEEQIQALPLIFQDIKLATKHDDALSKALGYVRTGWTKEVPNDVQAYVQQAVTSNTAAASLHPWVSTNAPWTHVNHEGQFLAKMFS